eukprot:m.114737 g.114737  ORF g.114737 m.114737 type:complete len:639 (+) comp10855_c0_seq3:338-2254(+)
MSTPGPAVAAGADGGTAEKKRGRFTVQHIDDVGVGKTENGTVSPNNGARGATDVVTHAEGTATSKVHSGPTSPQRGAIVTSTPIASRNGGDNHGDELPPPALKLPTASRPSSRGELSVSFDEAPVVVGESAPLVSLAVPDDATTVGVEVTADTTDPETEATVVEEEEKVGRFMIANLNNSRVARADSAHAPKSYQRSVTDCPEVGEWDIAEQGPILVFYVHDLTKLEEPPMQPARSRSNSMVSQVVGAGNFAMLEPEATRIGRFQITPAVVSPEAMRRNDAPNVLGGLTPAARGTAAPIFQGEPTIPVGSNVNDATAGVVGGSGGGDGGGGGGNVGSMVDDTAGGGGGVSTLHVSATVGSTVVDASTTAPATVRPTAVMHTSAAAATTQTDGTRTPPRRSSSPTLGGGGRVIAPIAEQVEPDGTLAVALGSDWASLLARQNADLQERQRLMLNQLHRIETAVGMSMVQRLEVQCEQLRRDKVQLQRENHMLESTIKSLEGQLHEFQARVHSLMTENARILALANMAQHRNGSGVPVGNSGNTGPTMQIPIPGFGMPVAPLIGGGGMPYGGQQGGGISFVGGPVGSVTTSQTTPTGQGHFHLPSHSLVQDPVGRVPSPKIQSRNMGSKASNGGLGTNTL